DQFHAGMRTDKTGTARDDHLHHEGRKVGPIAGPVHLRVPMRSRVALLAVLLVMALYALVAWRWVWNGPPGRDWRTIVRSDVRGYHGYLHALFITHDLGHEQPNGEYIHGTPSGTLNKYFVGESVMLAPFFLGAHAVAQLTGAPTDGLSAPYQKSISL